LENPNPAIPESAIFEMVKISIEGMRDEFWKKRTWLLVKDIIRR